jgi:hypothetical protein
MIPYPGHSIPGVPSFWFVQKKFFTAAWYASQYDWYLRSQFSQTGKLEGRPALKRDLEQRIDVWRDEDSRQNIGHLWTELDPGETRSGSPLVIPTGFVIGMIQNEHWQIGIDLIRSFLEQHLPGFGGQSVPSTPEGKPSSGPSRVHNSGLFRSG